MTATLIQFPSRDTALGQYCDAIAAHLLERDQHDEISADEVAYIESCFDRAVRSDLVATAIGAQRSLNVILLVRR